MIGEKFVNRAKIQKSFDVPLRRMIYLFLQNTLFKNYLEYGIFP